MSAIREHAVLRSGKWSLTMRQSDDGRPDYYVVSDGWFTDYPLMGNDILDTPPISAKVGECESSE